MSEENTSKVGRPKSDDPSEAHTVRAPRSVWERLQRQHGEKWRAKVGELVTHNSTLGLTADQIRKLREKAEIIGISPEDLIGRIVDTIDVREIEQRIHAIRLRSEENIQQAVLREKIASQTAIHWARTGADYDPVTNRVTDFAPSASVAVINGVRDAVDRLAVQVVPEVPPTPPTATNVPAAAIAPVPETPEWHTQAPEAMPVRLTLGFGPVVGAA